MKRNYIGFAKMGNVFGPADGRGEYTKTLPSGHYKVDYDRYEDALVVHSFTPKMDEILNLGVKEFEATSKNVAKFLAPETATLFKEQGFLLKRSFLFEGPPGTGKSVLATKLAQQAIDTKNAIGIYPSCYEALERMLEVIGETDPERFVALTLEEFDSLVREDESSWTTLLDGQFQSANRLLVATTNHVEHLPKRLLRPGRFSSIVHIPALTSEARRTYLQSKKVNAELIDSIVENTQEFTVDELKEVVQNAYILGESSDDVIASIRACKALGKE